MAVGFWLEEEHDLVVNPLLGSVFKLVHFLVFELFQAPVFELRALFVHSQESPIGGENAAVKTLGDEFVKMSLERFS